MLIQVPQHKRLYDPGVEDLIRYFDQQAVLERAIDEGRSTATQTIYDINLLKSAERDELVKEIWRCQDNFEYTARNYFEIVDAKGNEVPFSLWPSQGLALEKWYELKQQGKQQKIQIIKARRLGMSTLIESLMSWSTMFHPNTPGIIISNESKHASYLFRMLLHIYDKLPWWMKPMVSSRKEEEGLIFNNPDPRDRRVNPGLQSEILVQAATQVSGSGGQGRRIACAHLSEYCNWPDGALKEILKEDLTPALGEDPDAFAFLESTAKGAGRYAHRLWRDNVELKDDAEWYPLFMPWFFEKERVLAPPNGWRPDKKEAAMRDRAMRDWLRCSNDKCSTYREFSVYPELFEELCPKCQQGKMMPLLLADSQLRWMWHRRINAERDEETRKLLVQEYCSTGEESFQVSGYQVFGDDILEYLNTTAREPLAEGDFDSKGQFHAVKNKKTKHCYQPWCQINHTNDDNPLKIWKLPEQGREYVAGVDVAEGLGGDADYSVVAINMKGRVGIEPDELVAVYRNNTIDPLPFGAVCNWIGRWYNNALMSVECNKYDTTLSQLRQNYSYPNIFRWKQTDATNMLTNKWGWWTNMSSKPRLWQWAKKWLKDRSWIVYDSEFMEELKTFQKESPEDRGAAAEEGMHDDVAIAAFIALYTSHDMDFSDSSEVPSPLKINTNSETQPQSSWTASCTRCMGPAWQVDNPEGVRCPYCQCRIIKAVPNHAARREVEIDFDEVGREPSEEPEVSKTSFEYSLGFR